MFELNIARRYLVPKKKQLSVSLIAIMSVGVISLVVWLLLLFLSITEGIEKNWLKKLTALNAPIRIYPTEAYYTSYYYQVDSLSSASDYNLKSIYEKFVTDTVDPYDPSVDEVLPTYWPKRETDMLGKPLDLVKGVFSIVDGLKEDIPDVRASDYEVGGALLRLRLLRNDLFDTHPQQSFLTQVSYVASLDESADGLKSLVIKPRAKDLNNLLYLSDLKNIDSNEETPTFPKRDKNAFNAKSVFIHGGITKVKNIPYLWQLNKEALPKKRIHAFTSDEGGRISYFLIPSESHFKKQPLATGFLTLQNDGFFLYEQEGKPSVKVSGNTPLYLYDAIEMSATIDPADSAESFKDITLLVKGSIQGEAFEIKTFWDKLEVVEANPKLHFEETPSIKPQWVYWVKEKCFLPNEEGILIPKSFQDNEVKLGDRGFLAYGASTTTAVQEQRLSSEVVGFYDPGLMPVGARYILADRTTVRGLNAASHALSVDPMLTNGIQVWYSSLSDTHKIAQKIQKELDGTGLAAYWKLSTFYDYDFAKDLMQQFRSDRYLFTLIGLIILLVACTNIISLLLLLVNDKRKEIGILLSMGASKRSIAMIFGICGTLMGVVSSLVGGLLAFFTLRHIDSVVHILSLMQGQKLFNEAIFGSHLPNEMSKNALFIIVFATPILSMIAGLIPAIKACKVKPSAILRSE